MMAGRDLLFDTQATIHWISGDIPPEILRRVQNGASVSVSIVSLWEFQLKAAYYDIGITFDHLQQAVRNLRARLLPIHIRHLEILQALPFINNHKDPFDRLIISQAISGGLWLVGADREFPKYAKALPGQSLKVLWA